MRTPIFLCLGSLLTLSTALVVAPGAHADDAVDGVLNGTCQTLPYDTVCSTTTQLDQDSRCALVVPGAGLNLATWMAQYMLLAAYPTVHSVKCAASSGAEADASWLDQD